MLVAFTMMRLIVVAKLATHYTIQWREDLREQARLNPVVTADCQ